MSSAADKIKNFFKRGKKSSAFKTPGRRLDSTTVDTSNRPKPRSDAYVPPKRTELTSEAKAAAEAAIARTARDNGSKDFNTSMAAIRARVRHELEAEKLKLKQSAEPVGKSASIDELQNLAVEGVYFRCPLICNEVLPRNEWKVKIKEFLYEQLTEERALTACLIIKNCNIKDKADSCIETLKKYIENIINNPNEEKYRTIRKSNKIFSEKVKCVEGALDFLLGAGFTETNIDGEDFLIYCPSELEPVNLSDLLDALKDSEIIQLDLDRNVQALLPSQSKKTHLPPDFFRPTADDIKREQQIRTTAIEESQILKTKEMREREETRALKQYKYALVRVRFPDGITLQGTFYVYEKLSDIYEFVTSNLKREDLEYQLLVLGGQKFTDTDLNKTLFDLRLIPQVIFTFICNDDGSAGGSNAESYLKEDVLMMIRSI